ncbi:MAG TPA: hypothetical protein IGS17_00040 [Oscillatoriales cyanobacterium M59_W2019_021]|nr:MAG: hypothetical protein D6728_17650 [Cyanobacteria bacterium J055]HIK33207.1 hypothetical protein [Oscillatoriales cyanobacterium M4454_W2019_049]HIK49306.1 hypothetical protein [Oscillatoriales cyanobacterium M59_W2019_021]
MTDRVLTAFLGVLIFAGIVYSQQPAIAEGIDCTPPDSCVPDDPRSPDNEIEILSPTANDELDTQTPTLSWSAVQGSTSYILRVRDLEESEPEQEIAIDLSEVEVSSDGTISIEFQDWFDRPLSWGTEYRLAIETIVDEKSILAERLFSISSQPESDASN